tara:strand:+ start:1016 stop:1915 length:900 start_codon:yes stop_codon:yes gene_type:complete
MRTITIGTRGSKLALIQAKSVKHKLEEKLDCNVLVKIIKTAGDVDLMTPIRKIQDKGFYTKEIENKLLGHEIDLAVHSMKDLPIDLDDRFQLAAVLKRKSSMDVLIKNNKTKISINPTIGVGSLRRRIQFKNLAKKSKLVDVRGNIETRIEKMKSNNWDGLIIAKAAVQRLSIKDDFREFSVQEMVPAPCQGVIAIEKLKNRESLNGICSLINHIETFEIAMIERKISSKLGGGCTSPVGCLVEKYDDCIKINVFISDIEGENQIFDSIEGQYSDKDLLISALLKKIETKGLKKILKNG